MTKNESNSEKIILVLVSAVLSGLISLFVYILYQENNKILTDPSLEIIFVIFIQAVKYLFLICMLLVLAYLVFKLLKLYAKISNESISRLLNLILKKLKLEHIRPIDFSHYLERIYENNKELFYFIMLVSFLIYWLYKYTFMQNLLGWVNYLVIVITAYTALDRLVRYIKSKKIQNNST